MSDPDVAHEEEAKTKSPKDLPMIPEAICSMEALQPFQDCVLVLDDARLACHTLKLAEVSAVLRWVNRLASLHPGLLEAIVLP